MNEKCKINGVIDSITIEKTEKIVNQMKNCICKIEGKEIGTGFFCKINYNQTLIPVLMTNSKILAPEFLKLNKKVKLATNDDKNTKILNIDENDIIYISSSDKYDIIIMKLKDEEDNENNYLELDESIFDNDSEKIYENESIYILHYPKGDKACVSYGYGFSESKENNNFIYNCDFNSGSSGAPILNLSTNKVIGINKGILSNNNYIKGTFLKYPLNELNIIKKSQTKNNNLIKNEIIKNFDGLNEIRMEVKINKEDINKNIYFLDNTVFNSYLKELNQLNTELYINDNKYEYQKYFIPEKEGIFNIKLKINTRIKDCSHMFSGCKNIINIDLSSFNSKDITNMSFMFYDCVNLEKIDLSSFDTKNVTNMESMFDNCTNIESLDLTSFDTKNVVNMMYMFVSCKKLEYIDLSSFDTTNTENMDLTFYECLNLKKVKINIELNPKIIEILKNKNIEILKI